MSDKERRSIGPSAASRSRRALLVIAACLLVLAALPAGSHAAPPQLWQSCESGSGAGQCDVARGVAANPRNGLVFVADQVNSRIDVFNALGQFVRAWGWGVDTGAAELQSCTAESGCQAGVSGADAGQFGEFGPQGIALDSSGDVYVVDILNRRVQKFDSKGNFELTIGGGVNETSGGNVCPRPGFPADVCKAAAAASGGGEAGEFGEWKVSDFITVDDNGTLTDADDIVYVGDQGRIQKFDTDGVYQGEIAITGTVQSLDVDAEGNLYFARADSNVVQKLSPSGEPLSPSFEIPKPDPFTTPTVTAVTVDASGHVFVFNGTSGRNGGIPLDRIFEFDPSGKVVDQFGQKEFGFSTGIEANLCAGSEAPGNLYVTSVAEFGEDKGFLRAYGTQPDGCFNANTGDATSVAETGATLNGTVNPRGALSSECRFEYGPTASYGSIAPCAQSPATIGSGNSPVAVSAKLSGLAKGTVYHFRLVAKVVGEEETGADRSFKTLGPPVISSEHPVSVSATEATLGALINPEGFATEYSFQYTTEADFQAQGFEGAQSSAQIGLPADRKEHPVAANLSGLTPGTAYRWRVIAVNSSGETEGAPQAFPTYRLFVPDTDCPNQAFRTGPSAPLPDCRAYEMVSPVDKNGGDIVSGISVSSDPGGYVQASPDGDRLTYTTLFSSFAGQPTSLGFNQYLATRGAGGWANEGIHPPVSGGDFDLWGAYRHFLAFSADLCSAWLWDAQIPAVSPEGQSGFDNLYRRENCAPGSGALEALVPAPPLGEALPEGTERTYVDLRSLQAISEDGGHALFVAKAKLTEDAAAGNKPQIYDRHEGKLAPVSVLPGGEATAGNGVSVGSSAGSSAVSADGSRVYWTAPTGKLYLRLHPVQGIVEGECTSAEVACTLPVSTGVGSGIFWGAAADGSKAIYSEGAPAKADLFKFNLKEAQAEGPGARRLIAHDVKGVMGASKDLSRVYFVSRADLTPGQTNSAGAKAQAGQPNAYLDEEGTLSFIATLAEGDVGAPEPGTVAVAYDLTAGPYERATRVSADGSRIVFDSRAELSGYDNADAKSGAASVEVYSYGATSGKLSCVSCNPSGARPAGGRELPPPYGHISGARPTKVTTAAWIPTWEHRLHASNVLSEDGKRVFFNSNDALIPRDTNGAPDVYEWEAAGTGGCDSADASYFPQNDGCLYLISSGQSPDESEFWEASPDGEDVFFTTSTSLLSQDPGSVDLYDARVGGGFPQPPEPSACEGEACAGPTSAPNDPTPASATFRGAGNAAAGKARRRCPKGKRRVTHRGKARCVARQHQPKPQRKANDNRRASR